jgi:hypothetical protein
MQRNGLFIKYSLMRTLYFIILLLFSLTSFSKNDSIPSKGNYHFGIFIESKRLASNNYGRFNFKSAGLQLGYRSLSMHFALNTFNKEDFQSDNYFLGERDKRKQPIGGYNVGVSITPYYHKKKYIKIIYKFDYYNNVVYGGSKKAYEFFPGIYEYSTFSFDDHFSNFLAGIGLNFNYKDIIAVQFIIQLGTSRQSTNNSHYLTDVLDSEYYSAYSKISNAGLAGFSLIYKLHSNVK